MLINCPHCEASYRIDSNRIPEKNSFVRCAKCSKTIPISGREREGAENSDTSEVITECEDCQSRYSVPLSMFQSNEQKVRCGKCSHTFRIDRQGTHLQDEMVNVATPVEDPEISSLETPPPKDSEADQYLESISLTPLDEEEEEEEVELSTLSIDEKSKFFLEPVEKDQEEKETPSEQWPDILDETEMDLDELGEQITSEEDPDEEEESSELIELESPTANEQEIKPNPPPERKPDKKSKAGPAILLTLVTFLLIGTFYWVQNRKIDQTTEATQLKQELFQSKLSIREPLDGQYIKGKSRLKRLFLMEGWIKNPYPKEIKIRNLIVRGAIFGQENNKLIETFSYAGKKLEPIKMENKSDSFIQNYLQTALNEKRSKQLLRAGRPIPFQIVFTEAPDNIRKLEARIISFEKAGEPIILE